MYRTFLSMLMVIYSVGTLAGCHRDQDEKGEQGKGEQKKMALPLPVGTPKRPQGMTALTVKSGTEPFSKQDVVEYFKKHNLPKNSTSVTDFQVDTLEFLTSKEVSQRLQGVTTGLGDNERVGFVTLKGSFVFTGPPKRGKPATFGRAYAVFDATTGNLLMAGTLERSDQPR